MNLCATLSASQKALWQEKNQNEIVYCIPFDLDLQGNLVNNCFLAVSSSALGLFVGETLTEIHPLSSLEKVTCHKGEGCGYLTLTQEGEETLLCRFTTARISKFSYVTRGITRFMEGDFRLVESKETETVCPKCGKVMLGATVCPVCEGSKASFKRLFAVCKPFLPRFIVVWVLMLATSGISLYSAHWQRIFIDEHLLPAKGSWSAILLFIGVMVAITAATIVIDLVKRYYGVVLGSKISSALRSALFQKVQALSLSYHDSRKPGDLMNRIVNDTGMVRRFMEDVFTNMFTFIITFFGAFVMMMIMDPKLSLISMVFLPCMWFLFRAFRKPMHKMFSLVRRREDRLNSHLQDVLQGIRVVKTFGKEEAETRSFEKEAGNLAGIQEESEVFWAKFNPTLGLLLNLGTSLVLLAGGWKVLAFTDFSVGEMAQYISYANMMFGPLGWFTWLPRMLMNLRISLARIDDVVGQTEILRVEENPVKETIVGDISFQKVTFGYKAYDPVLQDISFTVKAGESIGLVGSSGAGKSTMINLIMRLYDVNEGKVLVDGKDIRSWDTDCYHNQIGVVLQESYLFAGTVMENIRFAKPNATVEEVIRAAKVAGAHDFLCKFPYGYQTPVGEKGQRLSGGERQRIAIARAVLTNPRLLILDEATSSLDTESEFMIQKALERLKKGRTTFAIAHRLSTLKGCDRIFVIDDHRIAEMGSHEELMQKEQGIYKGLVEAQLEMHAVKSVEKGIEKN